KDENELNEIWRKRVKNDALSLKLAGKDWKSTSKTLKKRYDNFRKNIVQYSSEDVFQLIMNSYSEALDPHTNYLSPISSDNFKIDMSLSLEGIGAQLQQDDDYTKVNEIIPGGPAFKSNLLHRDDKITGVAQGEEGEMVDVIGWRLTDVVQLIRGPKGTIVRLQILEAEDGPNALPQEIKIVRDKVKLEEQSAKKDVIEIKNDNHAYKLGVISIPKFYADFEAQQKGVKDYKSTTRDVKNLIGELKKENVDGLIIDLRNNGGGALNEAIDLTGLFIKDGPVVQVKSADGKVDVGDDPDPQIYYEGPLAVLVNRFSASASEIFTGAIQDYGRGIIIGEQTYGKGTVQNLIDLNRVIPNQQEKMGQLKLTIAKYYRINGGSTQNKGVIPDIGFPSAFDSKDFGESSEPSALPWDQINSTQFKPYADISKLIPILLQKHKERFEKSLEFDYLNEDIEEYKQSREKQFVSLNEEVRRKEKDELEEKRFQRENERRKLKGLTLLKKGEKSVENKDNQDDYLLKECSYILSDFISMSIG
ncbi:MAG: carboxy terminal-processing peptidase, partial [Ignavibacteriaceae bacterium]